MSAAAGTYQTMKAPTANHASHSLLCFRTSALPQLSGPLCSLRPSRTRRFSGNDFSHTRQRASVPCFSCKHFNTCDESDELMCRAVEFVKECHRSDERLFLVALLSVSLCAAWSRTVLITHQHWRPAAVGFSFHPAKRKSSIVAF
ncbi:hypothetical protein TRVL_10328 [Trypanosoma vivax]|nr:hypothetical protein TRVL_10328 [Trypanosoma vivax]